MESLKEKNKKNARRFGMSKNVKKILLGLSAGVGLITFGISGVDAGQLMKQGDSTLVPFSPYPAIQNSYKVGYEIYQPGVTVTSTQKTVIAISFNGTEISGEQVDLPFTVTFAFPDNNAEFATAGSNYIWVLTNSTTPSADTIFAASEPGVSAPTISLSSGKLANPKPLKAGTYYLMQVQWADNNASPNGLIDSNDTFGEKATNPAVNLKNIQATCSGSTPWKLQASISGANGNIAFPPVSFAYVTPQYSFSQIVPPDFTAELDADNEFKTFVYPSTQNIKNNSTVQSSLTVQITDNANEDFYNWIAWSTGTIFNIKFALSTLNPEPGVESITIDSTSCTTADNSTWNCEIPNISGSHSYYISIKLNENATNNPTEWFLQNMTITSTTLNSPCNLPTYPKQSIGVWWGGVEAIVPFVKSDPNSGAQTYIVLYNRRDKDADVYAAALLKKSDKLVVPKTKIGTIPAQGSIRFTADDLKRLLQELSDYDMSKGVPIKFLVYVPAAYGEKGIDPYVEGIVVSVYGNAQRSVPLKFRQGRYGDYSE